MKKTYTYTYCDYCGKQLTSKNQVKIVKTIWTRILEISLAQFVDLERATIEGEGCMDCFNSFNKWVESRKRGK